MFLSSKISMNSSMSYSSVSVRATHSLRKLLENGKYAELKTEFFHLAKKYKLKQTSPTLLIPKVCIRLKDYDLAHDLLDVFEKKMNSEKTSLRIGTIHLIDECLRNKVNFNHLWKCYLKYQDMNGHLSAKAFQHMVTRCALECKISELIILINHHTYYDISLILAAEPLIMSGHITEFAYIVDKYLQSSIHNMKQKARVIERVSYMIFYARFKRSIRYSHYEPHIYHTMKLLIDKLMHFSIQCTIQKVFQMPYMSLLLDQINQFEEYQKVHGSQQVIRKMMKLSSFLNGIEITGFPYIIEDSFLLNKSSIVSEMHDLSSEPLFIRDDDKNDNEHTCNSLSNKVYTPMYSTRFFSNTTEDILIENGLKRGNFRISPEYYGSDKFSNISPLGRILFLNMINTNNTIFREQSETDLDTYDPDGDNDYLSALDETDLFHSNRLYGMKNMMIFSLPQHLFTMNERDDDDEDEEEDEDADDYDEKEEDDDDDDEVDEDDDDDDDDEDEIEKEFTELGSPLSESTTTSLYNNTLTASNGHRADGDYISVIDIINDCNKDDDDDDNNNNHHQSNTNVFNESNEDEDDEAELSDGEEEEDESFEITDEDLEEYPHIKNLYTRMAGIKDYLETTKDQEPSERWEGLLKNMKKTQNTSNNNTTSPIEEALKKQEVNRDFIDKVHEIISVIGSRHITLSHQDNKDIICEEEKKKDDDNDDDVDNVANISSSSTSSTTYLSDKINHISGNLQSFLSDLSLEKLDIRSPLDQSIADMGNLYQTSLLDNIYNAEYNDKLQHALLQSISNPLSTTTTTTTTTTTKSTKQLSNGVQISLEIQSLNSNNDKNNNMIQENEFYDLSHEFTKRYQQYLRYKENFITDAKDGFVYEYYEDDEDNMVDNTGIYADKDKPDDPNGSGDDGGGEVNRHNSKKNKDKEFQTTSSSAVKIPTTKDMIPVLGEDSGNL